MKIKTYSLLTLFTVILASPTHAAITTFNTGQSATGTLLSTGDLDTNYGSLWSASTANPGWMANNATSQWLTPSGDGEDPEPVGTVDLNYTIDLTGLDHTNFRMEGRWLTDNVGEILVNGTSTGISATDAFTAWESFTLENVFSSGVNTITYRISNLISLAGDNPTGIRVEITGTSVPEPSGTFLALLAGFGAFLHRRR